MSFIKSLHQGIGTRETLSIMDDSEPKMRRFCCKCRKMIRMGQQFTEKVYPKPFRREDAYTVTHYPECPHI